MNHPRSSSETDPQRTAHEFCNPIHRRNRTAPFGHGTGDINLGEILVSSAAFGVDDPCAAGACDQQNAVSFGLFDSYAGEDIGYTGAIACHADSQFPRQSGISTGHVCCTRFMARRDQRDSVFFERGIEAKVRAIDDTEYVLNAFGGQHTRKDLAAFDLVLFCHVLCFLSRGWGVWLCG